MTTANAVLPLAQLLASPPQPETPEIGWFCTYTPEEIVLAAGVTPRRLQGGCQPIRTADTYLHSNLCPYVRSTLDAALHGEEAAVDGIISVASCDALRRLHDAWCAQCAPAFSHLLSMPRFATKAAVAFAITEFRDLARALEAYTGQPIRDEDLQAAIVEMNRVRATLRALSQLRVEGYSAVTGADMHAGVQAAMRWPKVAFADRLEAWIADVRAQDAPAPTAGPRIFLAGGILDHEGILDLVTELGGRVVLDDLCTGERYYDRDADPRDNPWSAVVRRQLDRSPCARMRDTERRAEEVRDLCAHHAIDGVIYYTIKFCDPHLFDFVVMEQTLRAAGIPVLRWESDYSLGAQGQMRTRVEAFLEIIA